MAVIRRLVLVGGGHAHAQVLLALIKTPLPNSEVVLVSSQPLAPYSGMVPGWLAGLYRFDQIVINFQALCAAARVQWVQADLARLDPENRVITLSTGQTLSYDIASLNVGSTLTPPIIQNAQVLPLRPLSLLHDRFTALLDQWPQGASTAPVTVTAVGGGAAGFESLLAVVERLRQFLPRRQVCGHLVNKGDVLLPGLSPSARLAALRALRDADIQLSLNTVWRDGEENPLGSAQSQQGNTGNDLTAPERSGDHLILWATGAEAHGWQKSALTRGTLSVSDQGYILIDRELRSVSHPDVFAVGDCAAWETPLPKAGVFAVRMGPILIHNLRATFGLGRHRSYKPQRHFLMLLSTGNGRAIASRGPFGCEGQWVWRWKNFIDGRFVQRFVLKKD
jgi:pyridine nucleotide-disulfide oxidoreductase family protein